MAECDPVILQCQRLIGGGVFYDIGANIGVVSEALVGHAGRIVAVEADRAHG
jgi:precorrin-6B methylase 2